MSTDQPTLRKKSEFPLEDIDIALLVPSEPNLDEQSVREIKDILSNGGTIAEPRVSPIDEVYYVRDGNHRIMALKQLGQQVIRCKVQPRRVNQNVADHDVDDCRKMVKKGHLGFENLTITTKEEKELAYLDEDMEEELEIDLTE